jgi:hypothetical protein
MPLFVNRGDIYDNSRERQREREREGEERLCLQGKVTLTKKAL